MPRRPPSKVQLAIPRPRKGRAGKGQGKPAVAHAPLTPLRFVHSRKRPRTR